MIGPQFRILPVLFFSGKRRTQHTLSPRLVCNFSATCILTVCGILAASQPVQAETAVFTALDKVTARISRLEVPVDTPVRFGTLDVLVRVCYKRPPEEPPETTAFVQVIESAREGRPDTLLFSGWMFASDPGLNALEHSVYDVWLIDCKTDNGSSPDRE